MCDQGIQRKLEFLQLLQPRKQSEYECEASPLKSLFCILTQDFSFFKAKVASKQERVNHNLTSKSLSYGEIDFDSLSIAIKVAKLNKGGVFYDLGSGVGKGVIAASFLHQFSHCRGVEILSSLHEMALRLREHIMKNRNILADEMEKQGIDDYEYPSIEFINQDLGDVLRLDRWNIHFRVNYLLRSSSDENDVAKGSPIAARKRFRDANQETRTRVRVGDR